MNLNETYNKETLLKFLEEDFLPDFEIDERKVVLPDSSKEITEAKFLGRSGTLDLDVYEFRHKGSHQKRVGLTLDGFKILKQSQSYKALVAYYSENEQEWRLSLMTQTPKRTEKGKVTVEKSNPKRYSFLLGPEAKTNTPYQYLLQKGKVSDFEELQSRFSVEVVNKEFYKSIANLYTELVGGERGEGKNKQVFPGVLKLASTAAHSVEQQEFAVRLIGRLMFCWFLREKKGNSEIPLIPNDILSLDSIKKSNDVYHTVLEPLFFELLNKHHDSRKPNYQDEPYAYVPYLNGGLFTPHQHDYYSSDEGKQAVNHNIVNVPDDWIERFVEVLDLFNFTVDENTSYDIDLSIDPEMLGRVFENLLAEINPETGKSARKSTGSYYTPREIVEYMVDESIFQYLKQKTEVDDDKLRALISFDLEDDQDYPLNDEDKEKVIDALAEVKILDPACGSGAFPIGALQKIVFMLQQADPDAQLWLDKQLEMTSPEVKRIIEREFKERNFDYIRKLAIIRESIFGVDIQPIATEISRLRCFLTLVVDERVDDSTENRGIEPLPNLDFKFVSANTLLKLPEDPNQSIFEDREGIERLKEVRDEYFNATNSDRERLKSEFKDIQQEMLERTINLKGEDKLTMKLSTWKPFKNETTDWFDPEWMFGVEGFDIVIANPPYINTKSGIDNAEKEYYKMHYESSTKQFDLFALFIERAVFLSKDGVSFIVPKPFLVNENYEVIRKIVIENGINRVVVGSNVFEAADVESCVFIANKKSQYNSVEIFEYKKANFQYKSTISKTLFTQSPFSIINTEIDLIDVTIFEKIAKAKATLKDFLELKRGVEAGKKDESITLDPTDYKLLRGGDVQRYKINYHGYYIIFDKNNSKKFKKLDLYIEPKLLVRRVSNNLISTYDDEGYVVLNTLYCGIPLEEEENLLWLTALLNSSLLSYWFKKMFILTDRLFPYIRKSQLELIPVFFDEEITEELASISKQILTLNKKTNSDAKVNEYEKQIDHLVYELYGLTEEEIEIIENS